MDSSPPKLTDSQIQIIYICTYQDIYKVYCSFKGIDTQMYDVLIKIYYFTKYLINSYYSHMVLNQKLLQRHVMLPTVFIICIIRLKRPS